MVHRPGSARGGQFHLVAGSFMTLDRMLILGCWQLRSMLTE
jgi:hypothetical protein